VEPFDRIALLNDIEQLKSSKPEDDITMNATLKAPKEIARKTEVAKSDKTASLTTDRHTLIEGLNHDLAGEYQAILMYTHYSAKLTGPFRRELRALFQAEVAEEQGHAQFLSDKIAALGGEPTTEPRPVPHVNEPKEMLECALSAEEQAIAGYTMRIRQAETCGELGLKVELENQLADETRHKDELQRILAGWYESDPEPTKNVDRWQDDGGQG
jgi:bacterioferritin